MMDEVVTMYPEAGGEPQDGFSRVKVEGSVKRRR